VNSSTLMRNLGLPRSSRVLVVQCDDVGMAGSINSAVYQGIERGSVDAAGLMPTCGRFPDAAAMASKWTHLDWGLHATVTCEWQSGRWGPLTHAHSLCDRDGLFWPDVEAVNSRAAPMDVERELEAQVACLRAHGVRPAYIDCHMYALYRRRDLMEAMLAVAKRNGMPAIISREVATWEGLERNLLRDAPAILVRTIRISSFLRPPARQWISFYRALIESLRPGVSQLLLHPGRDTRELRSMTKGASAYGASWRARDLAFLVSRTFEQILRANSVCHARWTDVAAALS
jgi:chitin disaccharide deacetylase